MSKGHQQRKSQVTRAQWDRNHARTFGDGVSSRRYWKWYRNPGPCGRYGIDSCLGCEETVPYSVYDAADDLRRPPAGPETDAEPEKVPEAGRGVPEA